MFVTQVSGSPFPEPDSGAPGCHPATGNHIDKGATHPRGSSDLRAGTAPVPPQSTAEPGLRRGLCVHLNPPVCPGPDTLSRSPRQALRPPPRTHRLPEREAAARPSQRPWPGTRGPPDDFPHTDGQRHVFQAGGFIMSYNHGNTERRLSQQTLQTEEPTELHPPHPPSARLSGTVRVFPPEIRES